MNKIREIVRLKEVCGLSLRQISQAMKLSRPVVTDYLARCGELRLGFERIKDMPDSELESLLRSSTMTSTVDDARYSILEHRFASIVDELKRVGVTRMLLWEEYRREHPDGYRYSQFCHHFQQWADRQELSMHIAHKAGYKMFIDFAGKKLALIDRITGESVPVEVFVAILGGSKLMYAEGVMSQKKRDFIHASDNALWYMGGVPAALVPDNLKSAVTKAHRYEPDLNPEYVDFARHYELAILPARPYKPRDKALVEGAVKIVYQQIYAPLRDRVFHSLEELNIAIHEELERINNRPMKGYGKSRRELFDEVERHALRPLPVERYAIRDHARWRVAFNYHVYLKIDRHYYSVPYWYRKEYVDVFYGEKTVEIYHKNERIALHLRDRRANEYTTLPAHMPPEHRYKDDWNAERFLSWAESIDEAVKALIEAVLASRQHPEQAYKTCLGILCLAREYGARRLANACRLALECGSHSYRTLSNILKNRMEGETVTGLFETPIGEHENIRGSDYYTLEVKQ